jgi:Na+-transporting NADH:ubiquinone oxidoreductase subunit D
MMVKSNRRYLLDPLINENPVTLQVLGICSALAVTTNMSTALTMSFAVIFVLVVSSGIISLIRNHIIASMVIVTDRILQAWFFEISQRLSIFVGLIVTNCLVLGRAEAFAMRNPVLPSLLDGLGNGLGYSFILLIVAFIRELLGFGTLFGVDVLPTVSNGGWFEPLALMQSAPSAFFIIGFLIWALRSWFTKQIESAEFTLHDATHRART